MQSQAIILAPQDRPRSFAIVGEQITVLASGQQTGNYEIFLQTGPEGSGPPPHQHPWNEAFFVSDGEVEFGVGEAMTVAVAGTLVHIPAGTTHWFRFRGHNSRMISLTSRPGAARMFQDIDEALAGGPPDLQRLVEVGAPHGLKVMV